MTDTKALSRAKQPTEAAFTTMVLDMASALGWRGCHFRPARTAKGWRTAIQGTPGFPDLILLRAGEIVVAELKVRYSRTTPEQDQWLAAFRACGVLAFVWTPADWAEIEKILRG